WYAVLATAACWVFRGLLLKVEPHLLRDAESVSVFLDTISGPSLSKAIVGSAALSLFLELAVIRWQGTVSEFFAFYKNYGLLACFAGLGLGYAMCRHENGIPLQLTLPLLTWQCGLLIALHYLVPGNMSLAMVPFREQLSMGLGAGAKLASFPVIYLLLAVVF